MSAPPVDPRWPPLLVETLRRWALRRRRLHTARLLGWTVSLAGALVAAAMAVDLAGDPLPWLRVALAAAALCVLLAGAALALRRLWPGWRHTDAARELEQAAGLPGEPLSGPLFLTTHPAPGHSAWMVDRALALAAVAADSLDVRRLLPWRPTLPALAGAACSALVLIGASLSAPAARAAAVRALLPWRELPAPGDELLVAEPGDAWLAPGAELAISVRDQPVPLSAELAWADGRSELRPLTRSGPAQGLTLGPLHRDLRWRVRGPGLASSWRLANLVAVPRLAALSMRLVPPGYSGLPEEHIQGGDATVIAGADATIDVVLEGPPAATATLVTDGNEVPLPLTRSPYGGQYGQARLHVASDLLWHLRLIISGGPGGVVVDLPQRWRLRALPDLPPETAATVEGALIAPGRALRISVAASDDVALASAWLELTGEVAAEPVRLALPVASGTRRLEATAVVVPADLGAHPGDRLTAVPVARDRAGTETRGAPIVITVAQPVHAARHDLVGRLDELSTLAGTAVEAAAECEKAWRAAARAWREEDPAAGAAGLRAAAVRARSLAVAATAVADGSEAASMLGGAPANLEALTLRATAVAGGALALAARSASAEGGSAEAVSGAAAAAAALVDGAGGLANSAILAGGAAAAAAATADLEAARDQLAGAGAVLTAERAWAMPSWQPGLLGNFWPGAEPGVGEVVHHGAEVPACTDREIPGIGRVAWCARWVGQVLLPTAGRWTFRCTADDGVRLRVAGSELLPVGSWRDQGATAYLGSLELPAGWQPIALEYYQGQGGSSLLVEAGLGEPVALSLERLRHRLPPAGQTRQDMTALPAGAAEAAALRACRSSEDAVAAAAALGRAIARLPSGRGTSNLEAYDARLAKTLAPIGGVLDWSEVRAVGTATEAVAAAARLAGEAGRLLGEACRHDGRGNGSVLADRLREAAAKPGGRVAQRLAGELTHERAALTALAADGLLEPAPRATALAAAWAIDGAVAALAGNDADAARAAVAAAAPALALAARHARAAEAATGAAHLGGALLAELALSPGWPPGLLRPARDLLRQAASDLRAGSDPERAVQLAAEVARAAELEALRPGAPPSEDLSAAAAWLRDLAVLPQADAFAEIADLLERVDRSVPQTRPQARVLAAAAEARRSATMKALAESAAALAAAAPALTAAGLPELATRAGSYAELARTLAASPDQGVAQGLAEALASSLAGPLADALASGRLEPGSAAAQAGRLAARLAAAAAAVAASVIVPPTPGDEEDASWGRSHDPVAADAASAAAAVDFPEEHRAAIRAYLRRIGAPR